MARSKYCRHYQKQIRQDVNRYYQKLVSEYNWPLRNYERDNIWLEVVSYCIDTLKLNISSDDIGKRYFTNYPPSRVQKYRSKMLKKIIK